MKIFCIGFNKTGTVSLYHALKKLGYKQGIHGLWKNHMKIQRAINEDKKLLHYFDSNVTHFSDLDIIKDNFKTLDIQYKNSKFILNTRDKEKWLKSRRAHYNDYLKHKGTGKYNDNWQWIKETEEAWSKQWDTHHENVITYFENRPNDLLILDIPGSDGYEKLCPFLNIKTIKDKFPKLNITKK